MDNENLPIVEVEGVRGFVDKNNVAWLNAEDVAHGLGFVQVKKDRVPTFGDKSYLSDESNTINDNNFYTVVRWERVNKYLRELDCLGKDDADIKVGEYIPEYWFYLLAMKASNEAAKNFQKKIAYKIMPSIRRNGFYSVYETEIYNMELEKKNMADERVRLEIERAKFELARQRLENDVIEQRLAIASKLHEFAMEAKDDEFHDELICHAIEILINKSLSH